LSLLITNLALSGTSGTERFVVDLALGLSRRGEQVGVFAPVLGPTAEELRSVGIPVVAHPAGLPFEPRVIHGHHTHVALAALLAWPHARGGFVCHDARGWHDSAFVHPRLLAYAAVDELCRERIARETGLALEEVACIGNGIDLSRFRPRGPLPTRPRRVLLFSHSASTHSFLPQVQEACRHTGVQLDIVGQGSGNPVEHPENMLGRFDLVLARGRSAMEAMVCGCAVILIGSNGLGPRVTADAFNTLRRWNFGRKVLTDPLEPEGIAAHIASY
jgi:glycosyltransferase involved in cell wall biosynthesis